MTDDVRGEKLIIISEVLEVLPNEDFVKIYRSYIVALKYIKTVKKHCVVIDEQEIPLSSNYRESLLSFIDELGENKSKNTSNLFEVLSSLILRLR